MLALLTQAGLGKKKIKFHKDDDHSATTSKLIKAYPRLEDVGGYELFRATDGGSKRPLKKIDIEWLNVKNLRKKKPSGGGIIYIRPLQTNLDMGPRKSTEVYIY